MIIFIIRIIILLIFKTVATTPISVVNLIPNLYIIIATICSLAIVLIIIYLVNLKRKEKLFIFVDFEYSSLESIIFYITIFFMFDCCGLFHLGKY